MKKIGYEIDEKNIDSNKPWTIEIGELEAFYGAGTEKDLIQQISEEVKKEVDQEIIKEMKKYTYGQDKK
jgi:hypothetical protein